MAETIHLERRLTHRYVGTWAHLDSWRPVGAARILPARMVRAPGEDPADLGDFILWARMPRGQDPEATRRALVDHFDRHGCSHEYDCCGCRMCSATVRRVGRRDFVVHLSVGRNY